MSCENCTVRVTNVIGTPSAYKIRFVNGDAAYIITGPITAEDIRSTPLEIEVGGPGHATYGQYWSGNDITIRFENFYNTDCYLDQTYSCEPAVATTVPPSDCCDGFENVIETHGLYTDPDTGGPYDQDQVWGVRTRGFADGSFSATVGADGKSWTVVTPGYGKICFPAMDPDDLNVLLTASQWTIFLLSAGGAPVDGSDNVMTSPGSAGVINSNRVFADPTVNEVVYVSPNGICYRGALTGTGGTVALREIT